MITCYSPLSECAVLVGAAVDVSVARDNRGVPDEKLHTWFKAEETYARAAAASWIGDPRVRQVLDEARPAAVTACDFLLRFMHDQIQTTRFCWRVCRIGPLLPDGREDHGPFRDDSTDPWLLTEKEREIAGYLAALFHQKVVLAVAQNLAEAGVPLDPEWPGDQAVLAVLLLLPAVGYDIPWDGPIAEFAEQIQPPGVSAFDPDGRSTSARDGRPEKMAINADRIRKDVRQRKGASNLKPRYAAGEQRATWQLTAKRREILAEIISENPEITVQTILMTYDYSEKRPGGRLRHRLKQWCEAEGLAEPDRPSETTLYNDFGKIRVATLEPPAGLADGKVSG
jgi:hypothetical protein